MCNNKKLSIFQLGELAKWIKESWVVSNDRADVQNIWLTYFIHHSLAKSKVSIRGICLPLKGLRGHLPQPILILQIQAPAELL